ncbi:response regulator [Aliterella atlantica]|uniref:Response regulator receiver protein n=1 Tax=Aliterella atlantica CENA595 TaxID=1618023 RepID=A0A0D8ZR33_9CYAN|nr:response regulator [Aliterella atlantica]KJH70969.1 response regulator receiver protein [Aliterella atlantica CENA595]
MTKILVIEDEQLVRENILDLLEAEGFDAIGAENGHVGVTWAWDRKPDLIICDVMMPELDGYEVLKLLRKEPITATIPFIFLTAKADKGDLRQGMQLGADDYLTKPFTASELLSAIATRLERQAANVRQSEKKLEELRQSLTNKPKYINTAVFDNQFAALKQSQFTGQLLVKGDPKEWSFYFYLGRILYATGGTHPMRRWQRNVSTYCPQIKLDKLNLPTELSGSAWEYQTLNLWLKQELINREQASQVIGAIVAEVLFDSMQAGQASYQIKPEAPLTAQLLLIDADVATLAARKSWQVWQNAKFSEISPNQAPIIKRPEDLQQKTSAAAYRQLTVLLNGQHSLRDLAVLMKRQVIEITSSLLPYIQSGVVELVDIVDLPSLIASPPSTPQLSFEQPLIACIDDSRLVCQTMEKIVTEAGYQFIAVEDPLRALATLLNRKPDLIFLDLVMPNLNGYEICARLRKIPSFSNTPIVILTSNIIDRVRAKVVGSSDYMSKPIKAESLLSTISKHLSCAVDEPQEIAL